MVPPWGTVASAYMSPAPSTPDRSLTYVVPGMSCEHCTAAVSREVARVPGVSGVDVDLEAKLVHVRGADPDPAAVVAAIDEAGYDAVPT
jgi:copper chaperone